jgi:hypothetical protein
VPDIWKPEAQVEPSCGDAIEFDGDDVVAADDVDGSGGSSGHGRLAPVSFSNSSHPNPPPKLVFLKLDPDTVPVPHHLLRLLGELDDIVGYDRPDV